MNTMRIWQTTNTQNTEGTAQREGTQMSCRDDHELMERTFPDYLHKPHRNNAKDTNRDTRYG